MKKRGSMVQSVDGGLRMGWGRCLLFSKQKVFKDKNQENAGDQAVGYKDLEGPGQGIKKGLRKETSLCSSVMTAIP